MILGPDHEDEFLVQTRNRPFRNGVGASTSRTVLCQYVPNTVGYNIPKADPLGGLLMSKQSVKPIVVGPW